MLVWEGVDAAITSKGGFSTEPLIDHDGKGILIAGGFGLTRKLFGGHVGPTSDDLLGCLCCLSHDGDTKVGDLYSPILG
jgi:hypothetical protein